MVKLYADLVEMGYRVTEPIEGKIMVPSTYLNDVIAELQARGVQ